MARRSLHSCVSVIGITHKYVSQAIAPKAKLECIASKAKLEYMSHRQWRIIYKMNIFGLKINYFDNFFKNMIILFYWEILLFKKKIKYHVYV